MIKLGLIGCSRSQKLIDISSLHKIGFEPVGFFDIDVNARSSFSQKNPTILPFQTEEEIFQCPQIEAVYIASPVQFHFRQAMMALKNRKHVLCEVPIVQTVDQGAEILRMQKKAGKVCMMAENYCFTPTIIALQKLFDDDCFGDIVYVRTGYIHDCKQLAFSDGGSTLTWRGRTRQYISGNDYPTHSIGPVCKLLGVGDDATRLEAITSFCTKESAMTKFVESMQLKAPLSSTKNFKRGDISLSFIKTSNNTLIELMLDTVSNRPPSMGDLYIQGTKGWFMSGRFDSEDPVVFFNHATNNFVANKVELLAVNDYLDENDFNVQKSLGRLFPFWKILKSFEESIKGLYEPVITTEESVLWSSIIELSQQSVQRGSKTIYF